MTINPQIVPSVHPGGTPKEHLMEDISDAREALRKARQLLEQTAPNSRDYLSPNKSFTKAVHSHRNRLTQIATVDYELQELAEAIDQS